MLTAHTVGSKYHEVKNLTVVEIAKLVRKDLKQFNDCKFSVTSDRNSITIFLMNSSIDRLDVYDEFLHTGRGDKNIIINENFYNSIIKILDQYNFDNSETMTDYFHVNYYKFFYLSKQLKDKFESKLLNKEAA
jgi:hypothetical protein